MKLFSCFLVVLLAAATFGQNDRTQGSLNGLMGTQFAGSAVNFADSQSMYPDNSPDMVSLGSPMEIFNKVLNTLVGYPTVLLMSVLDRVCSAAISSNLIESQHTPDKDRMNILFKTNRNQYNISLNSPEDLVNNPEFKHNGTLVVFITGWTSDLTEKREDVETMFQAFRCRDNVNFAVVDSGRFIDTLYSWSALNTESIGEEVAKFLAILHHQNFTSNIHVIGHSLGAHIAGSVGRHFYQFTKRYIPHITGLDPARPCFKEGEVLTGLGRGDAAFVDVIHTNCGVFGQRHASGDVDFYPNGVDPIQPGCSDTSCSHNFVWKLYAEASYPGNEHAFNATKCNSLSALDDERCSDASTSYMGPAVDLSARGNYFLRTNRKSPYGLTSDSSKMHCQ